MILTVPLTDDGQVAGHFGRAHVMGVGRVENGELADWQEHAVGWDVLHDQSTSHGQHHARIVRFLLDNKVERVLFTGMGKNMVNTISKMGIALVQIDEPMEAREAILAAAELNVE